MREDTVTTKVFPFDELSDEAKESAVENLSTINHDYDWWDCTFEDAKTVKIKLVSFDLDRDRHCTGEFIEYAEDTAKAILKEHGETCETYQTAKSFLDEYNKEKTEFVAIKSENEEYEDSGSYDDLMNEFLKSILEDYSIILQKESEYLQSAESIIETIKANEYEFTENGKLY